jgi:trk system potassium uptake protein TrkH
LRSRVVIGTIGTILKFFSIAFLIPIIVSIYFWEPQISIFGFEIPHTALIFLSCFLLTILIGFFLEYLGSTKDFTDKEGFAIVSGGWLIVAFFASLPFILTKSVFSFPDAYFESMSGLTTTGATILSYPLENHLQSVLFWRALLQWLGGMGIIVLSVAVLTRLTSGGKKLIESEAPGPSLHKLKPTIMQTAKLLWLVYVFFTIAEIVALRIVGVSIYEGVYHAFTTMSTGGFSPHTESIAFYSPIVHWIIIVFMIIAGANFTLHYYALHGKKGAYRKDPEFKFYMMIIGFVVGLIFIDLVGSGYIFQEAITDSAFQSVSIMTTTGYTTVDYGEWSSFSRFLIFMLMFVGGCAGSTAGAIKQVRILLMFKMLKRKLQQLLHPNVILNVRLGSNVISEKMLHTITMFFFAYILIFIISSAAMLAMGMDMISGASAAASCLGNVGPALGIVDPSYSYAAVPEAGKIWLTFCMWIGRLEIFTAVILFIPTAYKREAFLE